MQKKKLNINFIYLAIILFLGISSLMYSNFCLYPQITNSTVKAEETPDYIHYINGIYYKECVPSNFGFYPPGYGFGAPPDEATFVAVVDANSNIQTANILASVGGLPVTVIDNSAFYFCTNLRTITINGADIPRNAFSQCSNLVSININGDSKFVSWDSTDKQWYWAGMKAPSPLGGHYLCENPKLESINFTNNSYYFTEGGVLFNKERTGLQMYPNNKSGDNYTVPDGVTDLSVYSFKNNINLKYIFLPDSITGIGSDAFRKAKKLEEIILSSYPPRNSSTIYWGYTSPYWFNESVFKRIVVPKYNLTNYKNLWGRYADIIIPYSFNVNFYDYDNSLLKTEISEYILNGNYSINNFTPPNDPTRTGYTFNYWNGNYTNITSDSNVYAVYNINQYIVKFFNIDNLLSEQIITYEESAMEPLDTPTKMSTDKYDYVFSGWDKDFSNITQNLTVYAQYNEILKYYTVIFLNYDETELSRQTIPYGEKAIPPDDPVWKDHIFMGWTGDTILRAVFVECTNEDQNSELFSVVFYNYNRKILKSQMIPLGESATAPRNPTKSPTQQYIYTFNSWDKDFSNITENIEVYAQYETFLRPYTVKFYNYNDELIKSETVLYGNSATAPETTPTREEDEAYSYEFCGWDTSLNNVTKNLNIYAEFISAPKSIYYTVNFYNYNNDLLKTQDVISGSSAIEPETPLKSSTDQYNYIFSSWDKDFSDVTEDLNIFAEYISELRSYTVTFWDNNDLTIIAEQIIPYGTTPEYFTPTKESSASSDFVFYDWDTEDPFISGDEIFSTSITSNLNVYIHWIENSKIFTVTFVDYDMTVLAERQAYYGNNVYNMPEDPEREGHCFTGWIGDYKFVIGDCTVIASYDTNIYEVSFVIEDGEGGTYYYKIESVSYGNSATAPIVENTFVWGNYTYEFLGWDKDFSNITTNLIIYAQYSKTPLKVEVKFYNYNNDLLEIGYANYGTSIAVPDFIPTRESTIQFEYSFLEWTTRKDLGNDVIFYSKFNLTTNIYQPINLYAQFTESTRYYSVTFYDPYNNTVIDTQEVAYGESATAPEVPERNGYYFSRWNKDFNYITKNLIVEPLYNRTIRNLSVYFLDYDGTLIDLQLIEYGKSATAPQNPTRVGYTFNGWDKEFNNITKNVNIYAQYIDANKIYTVTFSDYNGRVLKTEEVEYGGSATPPQTSNLDRLSNVKYNYRFDSWDKDFDNVTSDLIVYAKYSSTLQLYTISFINYDGTEYFKFNTYYGSVISELSKNPTKTSYLFSGWYTDQDLSSEYNFSSFIKGNLILYAGFNLNIDYTWLYIILAIIVLIGTIITTRIMAKKRRLRKIALGHIVIDYLE